MKAHYHDQESKMELNFKYSPTTFNEITRCDLKIHPGN